MVPVWTLAAAFVVGLAVGAVAVRLAMGRGQPAEPEAEAEAEAEGLGSGVEDVVAELERRYKGRRADGEAGKPSGGGGRRS